MKKVKTKLILNRISKKEGYKDSTNYQFTIKETGRVKEEIVQQWIHDENVDFLELDMEIKSTFQFKTTSQLGYLYAEVLIKFYAYMNEMGDDRIDEAKKRDLKMHPAVGFFEVDKNMFTGELSQFPKSFATASKEEVSECIDKLIRLAGDFGIVIETPEYYKQRKGIKEFTK